MCHSDVLDKVIPNYSMIYDDVMIFLLWPYDLKSSCGSFLCANIHILDICTSWLNHQAVFRIWTARSRVPPILGVSRSSGLAIGKKHRKTWLMMVNNILIMVNNHWLVVTGTMEFWMTFHSVGLGMESSSQLTPSFFRGLASELNHQPVFGPKSVRIGQGPNL